MITGTFTTAVGDITVQMDDGGAQAYVDVSKLGNLKYEFDQTPDSVQIDRTIALYSYIQVVYEGLTDSSEDLYTRLIDATATSAIDCTLSIDNFGVDTFEFSFELKQENIDYNEKTGGVSVRFTPKIDKEVTISNVIGGVTNYLFQPSYPASENDDDLFDANINCVPVEDYLSASMRSVFGNSYDAYIKLSKNSSNVSYFRGYDNWTSPSTGYVIVDPADLPLPFNDETIQDPEELAITANVTAHQIISGSLLIFNYYIEANNILNEFPVGTAIGWFNSNTDEVTGPFRIIRSLSSASNVVVNLYTIPLEPGFNLPDPPSEQIITDGRVFSYESNLNQIANDSIKSIAGIEGSIYGTGFSKNFYVHRLSDNDTDYITLKYDNVSELKQKKLNKYLQEVVVRQIADYENESIPNFGQIPKVDGYSEQFRMPNLKGAGAFVRGNENATKSLEINVAPVYPFLNKATKTGTRFVNLTDDDATLERAITSAGARSYAQSLNQQSGGLKIEFTYLDALALKPYEVFQFDSTAPEKYQNIQYRITSISYDFVKNECKVVGYQISGLATPIVRAPGPGDEVTRPPVEPPTGGEVTYNLGWNLISNPTTSNSLGFSTVFDTDIVKGSSFIFTGTYDPVSFMQSPIFGNGYWVNLKDEAFENEPENNKNYQYPGEIFDSNVTINVAKGWNIIPSLGVPTYPVSNTANISSGTIYSFDGTYTQRSVLQPGRGYWIYVNQAGDIKLNNDGDSINPANLNQDFKRVDIAIGTAKQSVFFDGTNTNTNVNIQEAFFPPPIGTAFDVRINQDETNTALRDLRAAECNTINIDVQQIDSATTLNITPKIGVAAGSYYQATFLNGDKIITALNVAENTAYDVPITTTRITLQPMGANIKLPVRAKDIANDDYVLTAKYDRVGTAQTGDASETVIEDSLFGVYDTDNDYKIEIGYRTNVAPVPQIFLDDTARNTSGANSLTISYDSIGLTTLTDGNWLVKNGAVTHEYSTIEETIELASFATNQDDYSIGKGTVFTIQTSATPSADITGIAGGVDGRIIHLINRGNSDIIFRHDNSNSAAANRFYFAGSSDPIIEQWQTISLRYVAGSINRWIRQEG